MPGTSSVTSGANNRYVFGDGSAARACFAARTVASEFPWLLSQLRPGMRVVDCGCGPGSITVGLAESVRPGEVIGFDTSPAAIAQARQTASEFGHDNCRFEIGSVHDCSLPSEAFDAAIICNVLAHVPSPERAVAEVRRILKPGGILAIREMQKAGDWIRGAHAADVQIVNDMIVAEIKNLGGDPFLGCRLSSMLRQAGFGRVEMTVEPSPTLSHPSRVGPIYLELARDQEFIQAAGSRFRAGELHDLPQKILRWMHDPDAACGISECVALARKQEESCPLNRRAAASRATTGE
jgi:SAM-dependent methyltransferase